jgi:hypothetical protein
MNIKILAMALLSIIGLHGATQNNPPKGFTEGSVVLSDGNRLSGFIKDKIRQNASVVFFSSADGKKKNYDGAALNAVEITGEKFICIRGDFFKLLSAGKLCFLQKASDASGKPSYNGTAPVFSNGTEGKRGDYFFYNEKNKELKLLTSKNVDDIVASSLAGNEAALEKAKSVQADIAQLQAAVDIYNKEEK